MKYIYIYNVLVFMSVTLTAQNNSTVIKPGKSDVKLIAKDYTTRLELKYQLSKEQTTDLGKCKLTELIKLRELEKLHGKLNVPATDLMLAEQQYMNCIMILLADKYEMYAKDKIAYMEMMQIDNLSSTDALLVEDELGFYPLDYTE